MRTAPPCDSGNGAQGLATITVFAVIAARPGKHARHRHYPTPEFQSPKVSRMRAGGRQAQEIEGHHSARPSPTRCRVHAPAVAVCESLLSQRAQKLRRIAEGVNQKNADNCVQQRKSSWRGVKKREVVARCLCSTRAPAQNTDGQPRFHARDRRNPYPPRKQDHRLRETPPNSRSFAVSNRVNNRPLPVENPGKIFARKRIIATHRKVERPLASPDLLSLSPRSPDAGRKKICAVEQ